MDGKDGIGGKHSVEPLDLADRLVIIRSMMLRDFRNSLRERSGRSEGCAVSARHGAEMPGLAGTGGSERPNLFFGEGVERTVSAFRREIDRLDPSFMSINAKAELAMELSRWKHPEAGGLYAEALNAAEEILGECHPLTLMLLTRAGYHIASSSDREVGLKLMREGLQRTERSLGLGHPKTEMALMRLFETLAIDPAGAEEAAGVINRAVADREAGLGPDHVATICCLMGLGMSLASFGDWEGARERLAEALLRAERSLGPDHQFAVIAADNLSWALSRTGNLKEALDMLGKAEAGYGRIAKRGSVNAKYAVSRQADIRMELERHAWKAAPEVGPEEGRGN
ncbi:MAG: tetratricopeptide repeat protein [Deltaproteobacteria bacterium]|jgi:tetratricopeptide (TPR) repeat protein|nr:tetratricopeptide repeat protein [Deltaproteobacteria bacterium]